MSIELDVEIAAHAKTYADLRAARIAMDRMTLLHAAKVARLEREAEALRDHIALLARGGRL